MEPNDVPKLYINADHGYHTVEELMADDVLSEYRIDQMTEGFEGTEEERRRFAYEQELGIKQENWGHSMIPFHERLGRCEIVDLPGDHFTFYYEKAEECAAVIETFLDKLG